MSKKYILWFSVFLLVSAEGEAQFHDNNWLMGYLGGSASEPNDSFGISVLSFYEGNLAIENDQVTETEFNGAGTSYSGNSGDLQLSTNGLTIINNIGVQIQNGQFGDDINDPAHIQTQSNLFLPVQADETPFVYYFRMYYNTEQAIIGDHITYSIIDPSYNGIGRVLVKDEEIDLIDSLSIGELTACRHANGRDWWIIAAKYNSNELYSILVSPFEVTVVDTFTTDYMLLAGGGQARFTPDGSKYMRFNIKNIVEEPDYLDVFDFDRCTGELSNHRQTSVGTYAGSGGIAISPSSQYLYVSHYDYVYQYDLWTEDIFSTKDTVAVYDGYLEWNFFHSRFFQAQLAPDGKIYLNCSSGVKVLHVINQPDEAGAACDLVQHDVHLPNNNAFTLANHPNYRLGPIDGSPCDTLGIDNLPRAYYRIDRNPEDTLDFHFQDLSFYEPTDWVWTFGDGASSTDRHTDHIYQNPGIYEVCLTVSNDLGSDTHCRTLELGPVAIEDPQRLTFKVFPNPVQDVLVFDLGEYYPLNGQFRLYNAAGQLVFSERVLYRQARMQLANLPTGIYSYEFWDSGIRLGQGKVIKQ